MCEVGYAGHEILGYGEGSSTNLLQTKIVDALRLGERSRASHLLLNLGHGSHSLRADDFVYILRYCATTPDALVSQKSIELLVWVPVFACLYLWFRLATCLIHWIGNSYNEDM